MIRLFELSSIAGETGAEAEVFADVDADVVDDLHRELFGEPIDLQASGDAPEDLGDEEEGAAPEDIDGFDWLAPFDDIEDFAEAGAAPDEIDGFDWFAPFDEFEGFAEAGAAPDADAPSEEAEAMSLDEVIKHCHVSASTWEGWVEKQGGFVTCDLFPWSEFGALGRATTWPLDLDYPGRNISCTCRLHAKCRSPARITRKVDQEQFLNG